MGPIELNLKGKSISLYGLDEVGRGPLAGPVVSCCCSFRGTVSELKSIINICRDLGIGDSKKLTANKRKAILLELGIDFENLTFDKVYKITLKNNKLYFSLSAVEHSEIDKINILQASLKSMDQAFLNIEPTVPFNQNESKIWVDGNKLPHYIKSLGKAEAIVKGDSKSFIISIASIIAKEKRDFLMQELSQRYPGYGFEKHAGYPTKAHKDAIKKLGPSPIHRLSFKGVLPL